MIRFTLIIILAAIITSCAQKKSPIPFVSSDLVGTWELKFDGVYPYWFSQIGFTNDGRKCVLSYEFSNTGTVSVDYYLNEYKIENGVLVTEVGFSSSPYLPTGYVIKDRIDVLEKDYFEVFMVQPKGSSPEKHQRLKGVSPSEICKIVENFRIARDYGVNR